MSNSKIKKIIELFKGNASSVLETITSESVDFSFVDSSDFDIEKIQGSMEFPIVFLNIEFSGAKDFSFNIIFSKKIVAFLSDLMMLGDGDVEYNPDEHNDAIQEMINQVLGSMNAEISESDVDLAATVESVELTDLDIQKEFLGSGYCDELRVKVKDQESPIYFAYDDESVEIVEEFFASDNEESTPSSESDVSDDEEALLNAMAGESPSDERDNQEPVKVSRAEYSDIKENRKFGDYSNVNLDLLMDLNLPITVELGRKKMKIKDVLELGQGSVIELDKVAGDFIDILINGRKFAVGEVMVVEDNFAIRVVNILSREDRIKSLSR